jgi:xanthine dehydrogenase accessory factor
MGDWARPALDLVSRGEPAALVTQLAVEGSTPREAGTKMLVWSTGQFGTIGGGNLEHLATQQARRMLSLEGGPGYAVQDYPLGPLLAQCCGGRVRILIERIGAADAHWLAEIARLHAADEAFEIRTLVTGDAMIRSVGPLAAVDQVGETVTLNGQPAAARGRRPEPGDEIVERPTAVRPRLALFGAGHVGQAVARALAPLPFRIDWYDSRPETAEIAGVSILSPEALAAIAGEPCDYVLILTHDHALDYALTSAALRREGVGFTGLIGSRTKRARFVSRLRADGFDDATLTALSCPIGIPELHGKAPEIIAVSVAADLLLRLEASRRAVAKEAALAGL